MKAKLFDRYNQLLQETDVPEALPTLALTLKLAPLDFGAEIPADHHATFRLIDTDETGVLIYRRIDE